MSSTLKAIAYALMIALLFGIAQGASADLLGCVDANGRVTYTNQEQAAKRRKCKVIARDIRVEPTNTTRDTPATDPSTAPPKKQSAIAIPLQQQGGTYVVPVLLNNAITLNFIVDSGAADVSIPPDVVTALMQTGTLKQEDFLGMRTYALADGRKVPSQMFRIGSMMVGNRVVENVAGSVGSAQGSLLLGQSFLGRFKSWSIDNDEHALLLE